MDALNGPGKFPKLKSPAGGSSPANTDFTLIRHIVSGESPISNRACIDSFSKASIGIEFSRGGISSFRRSLPPLSEIDNLIPPPAKLVDEDVLVMDGTLVDSSPGVRVRRSLSSDSINSASSHGKHPGFKMELCRSRSKFQFAHRKEEFAFAQAKEDFPPSFFTMKNKAEAQSFKPYHNLPSPYGPRSRLLPTVRIAAPMEANPEAESTIPSPAIINAAPFRFSSNAVTSRDWVPSDDGIEVRIRSPKYTYLPSYEEIDSYICSILYRPSNRRRLPVFNELCPR